MANSPALDQGEILSQLLDARADLRPMLARIIEVEEEHERDFAAGKRPWDSEIKGWEWREIGGSPALLSKLTAERIAICTYHSRSSKTYLLTDREAVRRALASEPMPPETAVWPDDLFDIVVGHQKVKDLLNMSLAAERPVHLLLEGPPGTSKSLFLEELSRLPGARYALGGTTSRAGLVGFLIGQPDLRYLIIDELDKADGRDLSALLSVMAEGRVVRLKHGHTESERRHVWVFAGCNVTLKMPPELLDRFQRVHIPPYRPAEFARVVEGVLVKREGCDPEFSRELANQISSRTTSVRAAVRLARLSGGNRRRLHELLGRMA